MKKTTSRIATITLGSIAFAAGAFSTFAQESPSGSDVAFRAAGGEPSNAAALAQLREWVNRATNSDGSIRAALEGIERLEQAISYEPDYAASYALVVRLRKLASSGRICRSH